MKLSSSLARIRSATRPGLPRQFGERLFHDLYDMWHQVTQKGFLCAQVLQAVTLGTAKNAAEHVIAPFVARLRAVGQREGQRANVIGNDPVGRVLQIFELTRVRRRSRDLLNGSKDRREHVSVVVAGLALEHGRDALEAHTSVDVVGRQGRQFEVLCSTISSRDLNINLDRSPSGVASHW